MLLGPIRLCAWVIGGFVDFVWKILVGAFSLCISVTQAVFWTAAIALGHLVASPTTIRLFVSKENPPLPMVIGALTVTPLLGVYVMFLSIDAVSGFVFGHQFAREVITKTYTTVSGYIPYLSYILLGMLGTNVVSLLYEIGRVVDKSVEGGINGVPDHDPESYLDVLDKIGEIDEMTKELAKEWFRKVEKMFKNGKIDLKELRSLTDAIEHRLSAAERSRY